VIAEVALTLVLLVVAGLLLQTFYRVRYADLGMRPEGLLTLRTALPEDRYAEQGRRVAFYDRVLADVEHLPGVLAAGYTTSVPLEWKGAASEFRIEGVVPDKGTAYDANHRQVSASYLKAIGMPLVRGRLFDGGDTETSRPVVIINETMARRYWRDDDPVGRRITLDRFNPPDRWLTIVGIVGDVRQMGLDLPSRASACSDGQAVTCEDREGWACPLASNNYSRIKETRRSRGSTVTQASSKNSTWKASWCSQNAFCHAPLTCGAGVTRTATAVPTTVLSRRNRVRRKRLCWNPRNRTGLQLLAAD